MVYDGYKQQKCKPTDYLYYRVITDTEIPEELTEKSKYVCFGSFVV